MYRYPAGVMCEANHIIGTGAGVKLARFSLRQPLNGLIPNRTLQV
jgi:hypothetical protein